MREGWSAERFFTATVDVTLTVGALEESVTVKRRRPSSTSRPTRGMFGMTLDVAPNAHTIQSVGQLIPASR
jgi:hypothetical protein